MPRFYLATHTRKRFCAAQPPRRTGLPGPNHRRHARDSLEPLVVLVVFLAPRFQARSVRDGLSDRSEKLKPEP